MSVAQLLVVEDDVELLEALSETLQSNAEYGWSYFIKESKRKIS